MPDEKPFYQSKGFWGSVALFIGLVLAHIPNPIAQAIGISLSTAAGAFVGKTALTDIGKYKAK